MKKEYRIKKSDEIQQVIKKRQTVGNKYFILYFKKNHEINNFRYALSVPKKYGNAVKRNLMKRRLREIIKVNTFSKNFDFFIVVKPTAINLEFNQIKEMLEKLFAKAKILGEKI